MKKIFLAILAFAALSASAQNSSRQSVSYADPAISNFQFSNVIAGALNADQLLIGTPVRMEFSIANNDAQQLIPAGTCMVKITLGSKFRLVNDLTDVRDLPLSNYFRWSINETSRQEQFIITGELIRDMPARYSGSGAFTVMPYREGGSTATCQLMVTNHGSNTVTLSDMSPNNNFMAKSYSNARPLGIRFTRFDAKAHGCIIDINWAIFDVDKATRTYTVEVSEDGTNFQAVKTIVANGGNEGSYLLDAAGKKSLTIRVKAETPNGQYVYSNTSVVNNICTGGFEIGLFPNPVPKDVSEVTIQAKSGIFNGKYNIRITDATGKEVRVLNATYDNVVNVKLNTGFITSGSYFVAVTGEDGVTSGLMFVKQ